MPKQVATQNRTNAKSKGKNAKARAKYLPGQMLETKSGKRYIVDQSLRFIPLTSKKNARRSGTGKGKASRRPASQSVSAPRAGSLQIVNGQTYVVGEDRKTYIPITQSAASGTGVLTRLLEIAGVILIADLVVDLIIDDVQMNDLLATQSFGFSSVSGMGMDFGNAFGWNG